jgi:hypothetical protein
MIMNGVNARVIRRMVKNLLEEDNECSLYPLPKALVQVPASAFGRIEDRHGVRLLGHGLPAPGMNRCRSCGPTHPTHPLHKPRFK